MCAPGDALWFCHSKTILIILINAVAVDGVVGATYQIRHLVAV